MRRGKSLLLLSPFFYPEQISTGKYNTFFVRKLVKKGCAVTVVSSHPLYPDWKPKKTSLDMKGVFIMRGGAWLHYPRSPLLRRGILELWYAWYVLWCYIRDKRRFDVVVPVFPPSLFFFFLDWVLPRWVRRVGIVHDLQAVYASRSSSVFGRLINKAIYFVEGRCFSACDKLIFLSDSMRRRAISGYDLDYSRCVVCYPFAAMDEVPRSSGVALVDVFDNTKTSVVYSGALGDKQNPDGLFSFLQELTNKYDDIECHIFSSGPHFERLRSLYASTSSVSFHGLVPIEDLNELYTRSDIQVIPQAFGTAEGSLPSKLPNLMAAGVPVFAICEPGSEVADLLDEAKAGRAAVTWDIDKLLVTFEDFLSTLDDESRERRRERLKEFVERKFNVENVVDEVLEVVGR